MHLFHYIRHAFGLWCYNVHTRQDVNSVLTNFIVPQLCDHDGICDGKSWLCIC